MDRPSFYSTLQVMLSLSDNSLLVDVFPPAAPENASARILRLGIAVNAFASLESYIAGCFDRLVDRLPTMTIAYSDLPESLKDYLVVKAANGMITKGNRIKLLADKISFYQSTLTELSSFNNVPPLYSKHGFSPRGSNVDSTDVASAFSAFGLTKCWKKLSEATSLIGLPQVDLAAEYSNLASTRNKLAHEAASNIPSSNLQLHIRTAINIGLAVDSLTTLIGNSYSVAGGASDLLKPIILTDKSFRFIDEETGGTYAERNLTSGRIVKRYPALQDAIEGASARITPRFLIRRDASRRPIGLESANGVGAL